ncbi:MAG: heavy-metal-associated domain-containing protein, partial [Oscillospiraceae bacterium]|nr:heavy-metal-associated domain-containing protein [Oscillospiraceae bacterium]
MEKEYILSGLTCAGCGAKIEAAARQLTGVKRASLNLMTQTLTLESENFGGIPEELQKLIHRYEPDVSV